MATRRTSRSQELSSEVAIVLAAVLYGSTYVIVQNALEDTTPSSLNFLRFALGALVLLPFVVRRGWQGPAPRPGDSVGAMLLSGTAIGFVAWVAYFTQNVGLEHTTTSNSAFITGLFAVFTPIFEVVVLRRRPRATTVVGVVLAVAGLLLLTGAQPAGNFGDAVTLVAAAFFGLWFIQIALFAPRFDVVTLVAVEAATVSVLSAPLAIADGFGRLSAEVWFAVAFTGVGCTAIAFSLSTWAQRRVDASRAGIINLLEPVIAGAVGYAIGERIGAGGYAGAALIFLAMVVAESGVWRGTPKPLPPHAG